MKERLFTECDPKRNYGIDLLRLVSMFMVVVLHVLGRGGILSNVESTTVKGEIFWLIEIFCYCAVNVFAIISGVVGLKSNHQFSNLIGLCLQLVFYSIILSSIYVGFSLFNGSDITIKSLFSYLFPSIRSLWYFSAYFCLFFFMPILNSIIENTPRNVLRNAAIFVFVVFCGFCRISDKVANLNNGYSVLWLAILYLTGAYISKYGLLSKLPAHKAFLGYLACVFLTSLSRIAFGLVGKGINILVSYTSPTILFAALFLVITFKNMDLGSKTKKAVAFLSPMAFGVYLIHSHPVIFERIMNSFVRVAFMPIYYAPIIVFAIALAIYISCLFFDWLRLMLFKACKIKNLSVWLENSIGKVISRILKLLRIKAADD